MSEQVTARGYELAGLVARQIEARALRWPRFEPECARVVLDVERADGPLRDERIDAVDVLRRDRHLRAPAVTGDRRLERPRLTRLQQAGRGDDEVLVVRHHIALGERVDLVRHDAEAGPVGQLLQRAPGTAADEPS